MPCSGPSFSKCCFKRSWFDFPFFVFVSSGTVTKNHMRKNIVLAVVRLFYMQFCKYSKEICALTFDNNDYMLVRNLMVRLEPTVLCPKYGFCSSPKIIKESFEEYQQKIIHDTPPRTGGGPVSNSASSVMKFTVFTDIHVDLNYTQACHFLQWRFFRSAQKKGMNHNQKTKEQEHKMQFNNLLQERFTKCPRRKGPAWKMGYHW